jgi:hypothetical protein
MEDIELQAENTPEEVVSEGSAPSEVEVIEQDQEQEQEAPKVPEGVQKRINTLTARNHAEKNRANKLEQELAEAKSQIAQQSQVEPNEDDFESYDEFEDAKIQHRVDKALANSAQAQQVQAQEKESYQVERDYTERINKFGKADFQEVIAPLDQMGVPVEAAKVIMSDENGPQLAYYLGNNLDKAEQIFHMPTYKAAAELGKISAKLSNGKPNKKPTQAPDPVRPIKPGGGVISKEQAEMSMEEIYAASLK